MRLQVKKWGNSAAVRIPASIISAASMHIDQAVEVREVHPSLKRIAAWISTIGAAAIAFALKHHYSVASAAELAWMLRPVGRMSGDRIRSPPGTGAMNRAPSARNRLARC